MKNSNIADWYDLKGQVAIVTGGASGLGLAIAKQIIELQGGNITVRSKRGKGTKFEISIPQQRN
mgnify:CR=1 FL=1